MKKIIVILIVLFLIGTVSARERDEHGDYHYDSWDEFYKYWNQAALNYSYVAIGYSPYKPKYEILKLLSGTKKSGFSYKDGYGSLYFTYYSDFGTLAAYFTDWYMSAGGIGKSFILPYDKDKAIDYWNTLLDNL